MKSQKAGNGSLSIRTFTSTEAGAWSNAYLISDRSDALLFDVFMLRSDATSLADEIERSGRTLKTVMISHAHPDHFMGLDVIVERFPGARIVSTADVVADVQKDGPWMFSLLQGKLGPEGPKQLVIPQALPEPAVYVEENKLEIVEFGAGESRHIAALHLPGQGALLTADLIYHEAHCYLQERHLEGWLARLDELEAFTRGRVSVIYPGHGPAGDVSLIGKTRAYLHDFAGAVKSGSATTVERVMLEKYPTHHAKQFLTVFTIPAYFPKK